jgi:hypothetical protein
VSSLKYKTITSWGQREEVSFGGKTAVGDSQIWSQVLLSGTQKIYDSALNSHSLVKMCKYAEK